MVIDVEFDELYDLSRLNGVGALSGDFRINSVRNVMKPSADARNVGRGIHLQFRAVEPVIREANQIGRFASVVRHQHYLRLVLLEDTCKFVKQTLANAKILCVVGIRTRKAREKVRWWKLVSVANDNHLFAKAHGKQTVKNSDL